MINMSKNFVKVWFSTIREDDIIKFITNKLNHCDRKKIDFVIQVNNEIIPIEVKVNKSTNHSSLTKYNAQNDNKISFRFSLNNLNKDGKIINIPLYFIEYIKDLNLDE